MRLFPLAWALTLALALVRPGAADNGPIIIADFEGPDYGAWTVEGEAFGAGPAGGTLPNQKPVTGYLGQGLANSYRHGDSTTGTLLSPPFVIQRDYLQFLIGGGFHPEGTVVELLIDGEVVQSATGIATTEGCAERLAWEVWEVGAFRGREARVRIADLETGQWGHINVDHIELSDEPAAPRFPNPNINRPMASLLAAVDDLPDDPNRPIFHFAPPAFWMNDPNGTIFHDGWYHLFYQHNPYDDGWGHMHWGHARSRDLVQWEHLPIALWPSKEKGEDHVYSGCAAVSPSGQGMAFYTSVGRGRPNEQWRALAVDEDWRVWRKDPANPLLTLDEPGAPRWTDEWRDPFVFQVGDRTLMVIGAAQGDRSVVPVYEATDEELGEWAYRGEMIAWPRSEVSFPECPNFFPLGDKWLLSISPYGPVRYYLGDLDPETLVFTPETSGRLSHGGSTFYAPNALEDDRGRRIVFGWIRGFPSGSGWNGCLAIPRETTLDSQGRLIQRPVASMRTLRGERTRFPSIDMQDASRLLTNVQGDALEIVLAIQPGDADAFGLWVRRSTDRQRGYRIARIGDQVMVGDETFDLPLDPGAQAIFHVYLDKSVVEVFLDGGRACATAVIAPEAEDLGVEVFVEGGAATVLSLDVWRMQPIWKE